MPHLPQHPLIFWATTLGAHSPLVHGGQVGDEQSGLGRGAGREVAAQGGRACSSSAGSLVISRDTGLDCSQKRRLFPRLPAFLSSAQGICLVVLVIQGGQKANHILRGQPSTCLLA